MKISTLSLFVSLFILCSCNDNISRPLPVSETETINTEANNPIFHESHEPKKQSAPFSDAVQVGDMFFLAGQIGMDHSTRTLVQGGIDAETTQALENIKSVLEQHDLELSNIIKATVILKDINDFSRFNSIYKEYLPQKPARTTFAAAGLAANASIEIEVVAVRF